MSGGPLSRIRPHSRRASSGAAAPCPLGSRRSLCRLEAVEAAGSAESALVSAVYQAQPKHGEATAGSGDAEVGAPGTLVFRGAWGS